MDIFYKQYKVIVTHNILMGIVILDLLIAKLQRKPLWVVNDCLFNQCNPCKINNILFVNIFEFKSLLNINIFLKNLLNKTKKIFIIIALPRLIIKNNLCLFKENKVYYINNTYNNNLMQEYVKYLCIIYYKKYNYDNIVKLEILINTIYNFISKYKIAIPIRMFILHSMILWGIISLNSIYYIYKNSFLNNINIYDKPKNFYIISKCIKFINMNNNKLANVYIDIYLLNLGMFDIEKNI